MFNNNKTCNVHFTKENGIFLRILYKKSGWQVQLDPYFDICGILNFD